MRFRREKTAGFTLLETLLASAAVALVAIPAMSAFSQAAKQNAERPALLAQFEFATSLLEERLATNHISDGAGIYEDQFTYNVQSSPFSVTHGTRFDESIAFTKVSIGVRTITDNFEPVVVEQIIARSTR